MGSLSNRKCEACRADSPRVDETQLQELSKQIPEWQVRTDDGIDKLVRTYRFKNFVDALAFTNRIGTLAEAEQHHPDLRTSWGLVEVTWWTHKIDGLHVNDFIMAAKSDREFNRL